MTSNPPPSFLKQAAREFWLPILLAIAWTSYQLYTYRAGDWDTVRVVNVFAPAFFLSSWLTSQYFRIRKQTKVESSFIDVRDRLTTLVDGVERTIANVTGGESFCFLLLSGIGSQTNKGTLSAVHQGETPLYDVHARICDLQKFGMLPENPTLKDVTAADTNVTIGNLIPGHGNMLGSWHIENEPIQSYNVFFTARNGAFTQYIRLRKIDNVWHSALRVQRRAGDGIRLLHEQATDGFPRNEAGQIDWGE